MESRQLCIHFSKLMSTNIFSRKDSCTLLQQTNSHIFFSKMMAAYFYSKMTEVHFPSKNNGCTLLQQTNNCTLSKQSTTYFSSINWHWHILFSKLAVTHSFSKSLLLYLFHFNNFCQKFLISNDWSFPSFQHHLNSSNKVNL